MPRCPCLGRGAALDDLQRPLPILTILRNHSKNMIAAPGLQFSMPFLLQEEKLLHPPRLRLRVSSFTKPSLSPAATDREEHQ